MVLRHCAALTAASITLVLLAGCDAVSPASTVALRVEGGVTNAATGAVVPGAVVRLYVLNEDVTERVLASVTAGPDGRYTLTHRLTDVVTEDELNGDCAVWNDGLTASVSITVLAAGYLDGLVAAAPVECVEARQTVDFALMPE